MPRVAREKTRPHRRALNALSDAKAFANKHRREESCLAPGLIRDKTLCQGPAVQLEQRIVEVVEVRRLTLPVDSVARWLNLDAKCLKPSLVHGLADGKSDVLVRALAGHVPLHRCNPHAAKLEELFSRQGVIASKAVLHLASHSTH